MYAMNTIDDYDAFKCSYHRISRMKHDVKMVNFLGISPVKRPEGAPRTCWRVFTVAPIASSREIEDPYPFSCLDL